MILEKGKRLFQEGSYGDALLKFEDAIRVRREQYDNSKSALVEALSTFELRRLGDDLSSVESYIDSHNLHRARSALNALYGVAEKSEFNNSVNSVLSRLSDLEWYPEAEYWKGEVFRIEGETGVALIQYQKALDHAAVLEIPAEATSIRYRAAELRAVRLEYNEMEKILTKILEADSLWTSAKDGFARDAMARTIANDGADKFLKMYRHASPMTLRAHRMLGVYYYKSGRHDRALTQLLAAFLIASTEVLDALSRNNHEFAYTTLSAALDASYRIEDIEKYILDTKYYSILYYLAASLYANGHRQSSAALWRIVAKMPGAGEWAGRSSRQLVKPEIEEPTENPSIGN